MPRERDQPMRYGPQAERDRLAEIMEYMDEDN